MKLLQNKNFLMGIAAGLGIVYLANTQASFAFIAGPLKQVGIIK